MNELNHENTVNMKLDQGNISGILFINDSIGGNDLPYKYSNYSIYTFYKTSIGEIFLGKYYHAYAMEHHPYDTYIGTIITQFPVHKIDKDRPFKLSKRDIRLLNKKLNELKEKSHNINV